MSALVVNKYAYLGGHNMRESEYTDNDRYLVNQLLEYVCSHFPGIAYRIGTITGTPFFLLIINNVQEKINLEFITTCVKGCRGKLSDLHIMYEKSQDGNPSLTLLFEIFFSEEKHCSVPLFTLPKYPTNISNDNQKVLSKFECFQTPQDAQNIGQLCYLMYNSASDLPIINTVFVQREERWPGSENPNQQMICDIQFSGVESMKYSFIERVFLSQLNRHLCELIIIPTHDKKMEVRWWMLQSSIVFRRNITRRIDPHREEGDHTSPRIDAPTMKRKFEEDQPSSIIIVGGIKKSKQ